MTPAQLTTFKTALLAAAAPVAGYLAAGNHGAVAAYYNQATASTIWRPAISVSEMNTAIVWSEFMAGSVQKQNAYMAMISGQPIDATNPNIRQGFADIFGTTVSLTNLTVLAARFATRFEMLFTSNQVCACFGAIVTAPDVAAALGS